MRPARCLGCERPMIPQNRERQPGHVRHSGRGLCDVCYWRARRDGLVEEYARTRRGRRMAGWADDFAFLASTGESFEQIAARLGLKPASLSQALYRDGHGWISSVEAWFARDRKAS